MTARGDEATPLPGALAADSVPGVGAPSDRTPLEVALDRPATVAALFAALSVAMTFPMILRLNDALPAGAVDLWQNLWNYWWWRKSLFELGANPYRTDWLFHPTGADLTFYTHSPFNMLATLPVQFALGPVACYNASVLLALFLSGFGAYLWIRDRTGDSRGAFLGGFVFAFFPQHMEQTLEHLNLFSIQFIPLALLYLRRTCRDGETRNVVALGLFFALNALADWHLGLMFMFLFAPAVVAEVLASPRPKAKVLRDGAAAGALAAALVGPFVAPLVAGILGGAAHAQKGAEDRGIDLAYLFLPYFQNPILGWATVGAYRDRAYEAAGFACYLGFVPVALAVLAGARRRAGWRTWAVVFFASLVLALGAHPWIGGHLVEGVSLPFALFAELPLLSFLRIANRFMIFASLALAMLVALGWGGLRARGDRRFGVLAGLILLEYLFLPYPMRPFEPSPFYKTLAAATEEGAVLDIPFNGNGKTVRNMVAQTIHGRPIAGGYLSTVPPKPVAFLRNDPALANLCGEGVFGIEPPLREPIDVGALRALGFRYAILHAEARESFAEKARAALDPRDPHAKKVVGRMGGVPDAKMDEIRAQLEAKVGPPIYEDAAIVAFDLHREIRDAEIRNARAPSGDESNSPGTGRPVPRF